MHILHSLFCLIPSDGHLTSEVDLSGIAVLRGVRLFLSLSCVCLLAIVLPVHLRLTDSGYPFHIFKLFLHNAWFKYVINDL